MPRRKLKIHNVDTKILEEEEKSESDAGDIMDMIDDDDLEYMKSAYNYSGKLKSRGNKRKQEEEIYETVPRNNFLPAKKVRSLLPLKDAGGLIPQDMDVSEEINEYISNTEQDEQIENNDIAKPQTLIEDLAEKQKTKNMLKEKIGILSSRIVENPEENMSCLKELTLILKDKDPSVNLVITKLAMLSLLEVYKDIIPSYKIRKLTEAERKQKMKQETRKLQGYEESLLRYYKQYLEFLEKIVQSALKQQKIKVENIYTKRKKAVGLLAVKCLNEMLTTHPYFNFSTNIVNVITPLMINKNIEISEICCDSVKKIFKEDKLGEISLYIVKQIAKLVKSRKDVSSNLLRTFLSLSITEEDIKENKKADVKKMREHLAKMSRRERKRKKKMRDLENQLKETEAEEDRAKKSKFKSEILKYLFVIYFRILKTSTKSPLLTPVLEGLSKFASLINVEFFDDLISVLYKLTESEQLTNCEILYCLHTVFTILSGQGSALNIDPQRFFKQLYKILPNLHIDETNPEFPMLSSCLDLMIVKRIRTNTLQRTLSFIKRLSTISIQGTEDATVAVLEIIHKLMISCKNSDILLDIEENIGSGMFQLELDDPEHCNAQCTALWELHCLTTHYNPEVCKRANNILSGQSLNL